MTAHTHSYLYVAPQRAGRLPRGAVWAALGMFVFVVGYAFHAGYSSYRDMYYLAQAGGAPMLSSLTE